jgi:hypothetical protein
MVLLALRCAGCLECSNARLFGAFFLSTQSSTKITRQDPSPLKQYSMLRSMIHRSSICAFWLWSGRLWYAANPALRKLHTDSTIFGQDSQVMYISSLVYFALEPRLISFPCPAEMMLSLDARSWLGASTFIGKTIIPIPLATKIFRRVSTAFGL